MHDRPIALQWKSADERERARAWENLSQQPPSREPAFGKKSVENAVCTVGPFATCSGLFSREFVVVRDGKVHSKCVCEYDGSVCVCVSVWPG